MTELRRQFIVGVDYEAGNSGVDASTESLQTIEYEHHEIHSGSHYYIEGYTTLSGTGTLYVKLVTPDTAKLAHFGWRIASTGEITTTLVEAPTAGATGGLRAPISANNRNTNCWSGFHTAVGSSATVLTDSAQAWTINELIGLQIFNATDLSSGIITANTADTVTAVLAGGTASVWTQNDLYEINNSQMVITKGVTAPTGGLIISQDSFGSRSSGGSINRTDEIILRHNTTYCRTFVSGTVDNIVSFKASWYEHTDKN